MLKRLSIDPKTLLQELLQGHKFDLPLYTVVATHGAAHNQTFDVECFIEALDIKVSAGGSSRRAAEQLAATQAIEAVRQALPAKKRSANRSRARKSAQLSLPVAVVQEHK